MSVQCIDVDGSLSEECVQYIYDKDRLTEKWFFTRSPFPILTVLAFYLLVVLKIGPSFMAKRTPYSLSGVMRVYNVGQVAANGFCILKLILVPKGVMCAFKNRCHIIDVENCEKFRDLFLSYVWVYLMMKLADLFDTVFMVLRKKDSHITFLHLYHHVAMVLFTWVSLAYIKSHHGLFPAYLNVIVHTIMYGYYFLATFPQLKKYLWWKRHLTKLQLGQFALVLIYFAFLYRYNCHVSQYFAYIWVINVSVICTLFINFYIKAYIVKAAQPKENALKKTS